MLHNLRWREPLKGVRSGLIDAADLEEAQRVGRAFVAKTKGATFVAVEPAVIADASILGKGPDESVKSSRVGE